MYRPFGGDRTTYLRRFAERLVALLPVDARTSREERAALKQTQVRKAREEIAYNGLSDLAKEAWDGGGVLYPQGLTPRLGEHIVYVHSKNDGSARDVTRQAMLATLGLPEEWTAPIRCRFRIQEDGESSFARSRWREAPSTYKIQLLPFAGEWKAMPFQVTAKTMSMRSPSDIFTQVFEELEQACQQAQSPNAALTANTNSYEDQSVATIMERRSVYHLLKGADQRYYGHSAFNKLYKAMARYNNGEDRCPIPTDPDYWTATNSCQEWKALYNRYNMEPPKDVTFASTGPIFPPFHW